MAISTMGRGSVVSAPETCRTSSSLTDTSSIN
uniref:Uncharacterized protein n=1 Tax=Anguilla anguilla TaxID=7936 RepID=A0A0E9XZ86_ANGAN